MTKYVFLEPNSTAKRPVMAGSLKKAIEKVERQIGPIKNPRKAGHWGKEVIVHYSKP